MQLYIDPHQGSVEAQGSVFGSGTLRCDLRSDLRSDRSMPRSHLRVKQACGRPAICIVLVVLAGGRSDGSSARQMHRLLRGSVQNEAI